MADSLHVPVLASEVVEQLAVRSGDLVVDGTLGGGGHARLLADKVGSSGRVIAIDRDPDAVAAAREMLSGLPVTPIHGSYADLPRLLQELGIERVSAVLLDLGLSSDQLADGDRGFSFDAPGSLDLRFDRTQGEPAWRLLERLRAEEIADIIYGYGEERFSRRIARRIVEARQRRPLRTAWELADLVRSCVPRGRGHRIDPATRTFQALRIAVNDELGCLEVALRDIPDGLAPGGRFGVISFHSLEDRRVKQAFRGDARLEVVTRKPIRPAEEEVERNPRSRSARLRVARRSPPASGD